jgi:phosphoribosylglycinamide formyltransferase 1
VKAVKAKRKTKRIAILASGSGTNLEAIIKAVHSRKLKRAEIALAVSDYAKARALNRARRAGIQTLFLNPASFETRTSYEQALGGALKAARIDYIVLAGFMRILGASFVKRFQNRILNIHPALLPAFKGARGISDALKAGAKVTGVTVHFVTPKLDSGPIILQEAVCIHSHDTLSSLSQKIHRVEHKLYPSAIQLVVDGRVRVRGGKTIIR